MVRLVPELCSCVWSVAGQRLEDQQQGQRRLPTPKPAAAYGLERMHNGNGDLLSFLSGACIALWHLPQFRSSLMAVQVHLPAQACACPYK